MTPIERAAASFGGRRGLAKAMGVSYMVVCQWFYRRVPVERAVKIEQITNGSVTAAELRPDVFGKSQKSKPKPKTKAA